jgi:deoxycytidine triphosphate deaminase
VAPKFGSACLNDEIFVAGTWIDEGIKEASYYLRVAPDGMLVDDIPFRPGQTFTDHTIVVEPGKIAILSTVERFRMPADITVHC